MAAGKVRLDRALSKLGMASRTEAQRLIADGRVRVGPRVVLDPAMMIVPEAAALSIDGGVSQPARWRTLALYKPRGVVTTRRDPQGRRTVFDLLGDEGAGLVAVGRLDLASSGLLLLTSDTQLAHYLTDPANEVQRTYAVTVRGEFGEDSAEMMRRGIETLRASSVTVRKRSRRETHLAIVLTEGRNREIRRMVDATGHEVTKLLRVSFGPISLGRLQPGQWREVDRSELTSAGVPVRRRTAG